MPENKLSYLPRTSDIDSRETKKRSVICTVPEKYVIDMLIAKFATSHNMGRRNVDGSVMLFDDVEVIWSRDVDNGDYIIAFDQASNIVDGNDQPAAPPPPDPQAPGHGGDTQGGRDEL